MPVKKNKKKEHKEKSDKKFRKGKKKTIKNATEKSKKDSQELKKAVKDLPSVLMQGIYNQTEFGEEKKINVPVFKEISIPVKKKTAQIYSSPKNSNIWLWSAVIIFTIIIFILWIMSMNNLFFDNKGNSNGPLDSLKDSKSELQNIFKNFDDENSKTTENLKNLLTSSTVENNTTSTESLKKLQEAMSSLFVSTTNNTDNNLTTTTKNNN
ncbi:MAG: hypothetical protein AUJ23_02900 [Candidatus Magasanikbacteria bacterium CG1_02_32_51]|uniref:Uncharacterized protein n=1 Tax=Candidatus Magasanikbacteria bacterium CG1_02_32_51 TaxID=1805238 RepID=A0A1J4U2N3_9BACT|nr:MAG: hypothetical protein AUJ23_02900 [Candidatus Magasanikbacteria bacterium CG1_02_32_51]